MTVVHPYCQGSCMWVKLPHMTQCSAGMLNFCPMGACQSLIVPHYHVVLKAWLILPRHTSHYGNFSDVHSIRHSKPIPLFLVHSLFFFLEGDHMSPDCHHINGSGTPLVKWATRVMWHPMTFLLLWVLNMWMHVCHVPLVCARWWTGSHIVSVTQTQKCI